MKLTPARRRGLKVLANADRDATVQISNTTSDPTTEEPPRVYWQVARWLCTHGFAVSGGTSLRLTVEGRQVANEFGLTWP